MSPHSIIHDLQINIVVQNGHSPSCLFLKTVTSLVSVGVGEQASGLIRRIEKKIAISETQISPDSVYCANYVKQP